tara:strand:+ start:2010 stop:2216 length:207 start_codon:yes stop_codon:yes gene_type:complete
MNYEFLGMLLGSGGGILATWVKMTNDVTKIKARLYALEKTETIAQQTLEVLVEGVNEIKLLLAKKGIE